MGCCCFNTLRGAAFFVASVQIYNGLECMLKFIAFPMLFSSMHASKDPECARTIKWGGICFAITEISFFILRQGFKVTPTPKVPHLSTDEQPFEMNIYKTLYYFLFTIVGGLIYICILFLYLQQLSKGQDEFSQFFNITARAPWSTPTPTTTTQAPQPPPSAQQDPHHLPPVTTSSATNNNSSLQSNLNPGGSSSSRAPKGRGSAHQNILIPRPNIIIPKGVLGMTLPCSSSNTSPTPSTITLLMSLSNIENSPGVRRPIN
ncbi:Autophagy-related protein 9 [Folsomia candida]|uniref:Autophagy-related protein 9 n=1 Tax=Folsomia candida TaxID=158441 RepID=A0A226DNJ3_FOLCA|nr:Autophagy-related protein 9 [Folsomia candida]